MGATPTLPMGDALRATNTGSTVPQPVSTSVGTAVSTLPTQPVGTGINAGTGLPNTSISGAGSTGSTSIGAPTTGISSGLDTADGSHTLTGDFKDTYGAGTGTALAGILGGLGTATDSAVSSTNQQILQAAGIQGANIGSAEAAAGVSQDSSTAALAQGDFASQVNTSLQATDSQMELNEENTLISALQTEGSAHGPDQSGWDTFMDVLGLGSTAAQGASSIVSAVNPSADTGILDALGAL